MLRNQFDVGQRLTAKWYDPAEWGDHPDAWHQKNLAILRRAFTTDELLHLYDEPMPPTPPGHDDRHHALDVRLPRLKMVLDLVQLCEEEPHDSSPPRDATNGPVFVVHGHDNATKVDVARTLLQMTGRDPIILHEKTDSGRTIIEKFEHYASTAAAAVVILSPDDVGGVAGTAPDRLKARARQNVIFELGWFYAKLERGRVVALLAGGVERPGDIDGVLYLPVDESGAWRHRLGKELDAAGLDIDLHAIP